MPEEEKAVGWEMLLGFVILILFGLGLYFAIHGVYTRFFRPTPGVVSLAAYFVDDSGAAVSIDSPNYGKSHLKIKGDVSQGGQLVKNGSVRITISSARNSLFRQSVYIGFQNGHFETEDPAFLPIRPSESVEIQAEVTATGLVESATIYLNREPPVERPITKAELSYIIFAIFLVFSYVFIFAFTGKKTALKNRLAIILSYAVILIVLALPILAPTILIHMYPDAIDYMIGAPAGLINTHTPNEKEGETQWALNIGGYSYKVAAPAEGPGVEKAAQVAAPDKSTGISKAGAGAVTPKETSNGSPATKTTEVTNPNPSKPTEAANPPATAASPPPPATAEATGSPKSDTVKTVVEVQGGLVIPLYVIILSVIGGAINMTRKVPSFQREGEASDFSLANPFSMAGSAGVAVGSAVRSILRRPASEGENTDKAPVASAPPPAPTATATNAVKPDASLAGQAQAVEDQLTPLITDQLKRSCDTDAALEQMRTLVSKMQEIYSSRKSGEPLLKFNSFEDWAASHPRLSELLRGSWRVELLNQYMYLISAPFLAIVTYYVIDMLGLFKQGVVVVLSFSVGLISERIVSWILGIATGYLRTDSGNKTPAT